MKRLIEWIDRQLGLGGNLPAILKIVGFFAAIVLFLIYFREQASLNVEITPCSSKGYPGRCYYVTEKLCNMVWENSASTCQDVLKKMNLPPGRLTGPTVSQCRWATFDAAFRNSRKAEPECEARHRDLEEWRKLNMPQ
ncbi:MAG: hypothetical protein KF799_01225 [Bdellovibrionales bacterium]|nr:hypothetical protein [Bdellovibrionales bacterium]